MKVVNISGEYYLQDGKVMRRVSLEKAINEVLKMRRELNEYTEHDEGD